MSLLEYGNSIGLPLRGRMNGKVCSYTANEQAATAMRLAGARVSTCYNKPPLPVGWEIVFDVDQEAAPLGEEASPTKGSEA